jgi:hypothetical protein
VLRSRVLTSGGRLAVSGGLMGLCVGSGAGRAQRSIEAVDEAPTVSGCCDWPLALQVCAGYQPIAALITLRNRDPIADCRR